MNFLSYSAYKLHFFVIAFDRYRQQRMKMVQYLSFNLYPKMWFSTLSAGEPPINDA